MLTSSKISGGINGNVNIPGDKSISHRSIIIPSISNGFTEIDNILLSEDVMNTMNAFRAMGVKIIKNNNKLLIEGKGLNSLTSPTSEINLGNSGTTARLLTGLLSSQNFNSILIGDISLSKRPMDRIIQPLEKVGASFKSNDSKLPLEIFGTKLRNINYDLALPSAQVKSGLMLASLNIEGTNKIIERNITRNHTEIMLESFGADIDIKKIENENHIYINGQKELYSKNIFVPSDLSSAAFFIVATLINKNSLLKIDGININPTRNGILKALNMMGAQIKVNNKRTINGELIADLEIKSSDLVGCELDEDIARLMIDEYPILSIAASFASSPSLFKGLGELKIKESNRLELIRNNLDKCGIFSEIEGENLFIDPTKKSKFKSNKIDTNFDHRIAMSFAIMGTRLGTDLNILNSEYIKTSFPKFVQNLNAVGGNLTE
ncbi:MAG: 3-phosphoshikimate 1-carboxyvinyltransferase [Alphaproteobacteria bacterium MarineAlpha5_Bin8]|nr:MAG: 3-phosphoshikimate 1-carboxyvinyltransferase [Alphaproteobacteria bacterium MarineAlpha5_Bin7]PPR46353.1 MAG: 3-phosphoshikimate 1-carboxyvinyltransferase [Alphaproteobacteria bacterium MarineAlpha5_Bin8]PPR54989.1 MAG: 3-phosphoshikimate 1-carboxyvinyltransferase [Alphaproteobacteria bacterium MarineAlpha5_Bin6]|tara:strand:- start:514 stop:1821 length:1308 start_codon:yes stop_codon:yes gene_type:complete